MRRTGNVSTEELISLLSLATDAQHRHKDLCDATGPCTVVPHVSSWEECPICHHHFELYHAIGQLRLFAIRRLEERGALPKGSTEAELVLQSEVPEVLDS